MEAGPEEIIEYDMTTRNILNHRFLGFYSRTAFLSISVISIIRTAQT